MAIIISSYHSLFSCIVSLYTLFLLCFPYVFVKLLFSPLLISTLFLLLALLRLGKSQQHKQQQQQQQLNINLVEGVINTPSLVLNQNDLQPEPEHEHEQEHEHEPNKVEIRPIQGECTVAKARSTIEPGPISELVTCDQGQSVEIVDSFAKHDQDWAEPEPEPKSDPKGFLDWDVGAPLEVIYEAYEGEEEGEESQNDAFWKTGIIKRYPSLSRYYPESESDSESDSDSYSYSSSSLDEEEKEGLIEIALDDYGYNYGDKKMINKLMKPKSGDQKAVYHNFDDEDNLIEIDISLTKKIADFPW